MGTKISLSFSVAHTAYMCQHIYSLHSAEFLLYGGFAIHTYIIGTVNGEALAFFCGFLGTILRSLLLSLTLNF